MSSSNQREKVTYHFQTRACSQDPPSHFPHTATVQLLAAPEDSVEIPSYLQRTGSVRINLVLGLSLEVVSTA